MGEDIIESIYTHSVHKYGLNLKEISFGWNDIKLFVSKIRILIDSYELRSKR